MAKFHTSASDQKGEFTVITDLSIFYGSGSFAVFVKHGTRVWCRKKDNKRKRKLTTFSEKNIDEFFCWPKGLHCSQPEEKKCFTVFLSSTVIEQHAENEPVQCSRHFCSCLSFIIHNGYKSVKWLLLANNSLLTSFHTLTLILSPLSDLGSTVYSKIAAVPHCVTAKVSMWHITEGVWCHLNVHTLSQYCVYASANSQQRDKPAGHSKASLYLSCHCAAMNRAHSIELQSKVAYMNSYCCVNFTKYLPPYYQKITFFLLDTQ